MFNLISQLPRPAIKMMQRYFKNRLVNGAEVGVQEGDHSDSILKELNITKLYLIDVWETYKEYEPKFDNLRNYTMVLKRFKKDKRVEIIKAYSRDGSKEIEDGSLDFVYIDANHDYKYVYEDMDCWYPKVRKGGVLAGHDIFNCVGVLDAVRDWCVKHQIDFEIEAPDWYFIKKED